MAINHRRGKIGDFNPNKMTAAEWAFPDDGTARYCVAPGNVKTVATKEDLQEILNSSPEVYEALMQLINDLGNNPDELTNILNNISSLGLEVDTLTNNLGDVSSQLADIVTYPKKYGAIGDGVADDTIPFQNSLDNINENETVDLQGKEYAITGVVINKKSRLINGTILLLNSATKSAIEITLLGSGTELDSINISIDEINIVADNASGIFLNDTSDIILNNCYVNGSKSLTDGGYHACISGFNSSNILINNCKAENSHRENIYMYNCTDVLINGCRAKNAGYSGISSTFGERINVSNSTSFGSGASSISINSKDSSIHHCTVGDNVLFNGIVMGHDTSDMGDCRVTDNLVINATDYGISIGGVNSCISSGNIISNCGKVGMQLIAAKESAIIVVSDNEIDVCGEDGIKIFNRTTSIIANISDNIINNCTGNGIYVRSGGDISIKDNAIDSVFLGVLAHGRATTSLGIASTINNLIINNNLFRSIERGAIQASNVIDVDIKDNIFDTIATNTSYTSHIISVYGTTSPDNIVTPFPNINAENNRTKNTNANSRLFYLSSDTYDIVEKMLVIKNNTLTDLSPTRIFTPNALTVAIIRGNKIGTDSVFIFVNIVSGTTTTTITNSNITSNTPPTIIPRGALYYEINPYFSAISDGSVTLTHAAPASNVGINIMCV